jgi:hypothetical protein
MLPQVPISTSRDPLSHEKLYDINSQIMEFIRKLRGYLCRAIGIWSQFSGTYGDIAYFEDLQNHIAAEALSRIRKSFDDLARLEQKLRLLEESCKESAKTVSMSIQQALHLLIMRTVGTPH